MEEFIQILNLKTEYQKNPIGIDISKPAFSWQMESERYGTFQSAYQVFVWEVLEKEKIHLLWDSKKVISDQSVAVLYQGEALFPRKRYDWCVIVWDENGVAKKSETAWFETGLMGTTKSCWNGAKFIGSSKTGMNTAALENWYYQVDFQVKKGNTAGFVVAARDRENYILFKVNLEKRCLKAYQYSDCAWEEKYKREEDCYKKILGKNKQKGGNYWISEKAVAIGTEEQIQQILFVVKKRTVTVKINGVEIIEAEEEFLPENPPNQPRKAFLMSVGFQQISSKAVYRNIQIGDSVTKEIYIKEDFSDTSGVFSTLGTVRNGGLEVENAFEYVCPCPGLHLKKIFDLKKKNIRFARLYVSARGSYQVYLNGKRVGDEYLTPGFTDYRIRIPYQVYPVETDLKSKENTLLVMVGKGYYSGYCGYSGAMIYGRESTFLAQLILTYQDGTEEVIKTDKTWLYTEKGPLIDSDYLDGETYDARLEEGFFSNAFDEIWKVCGEKEWAFPIQATNGCLEQKLEFALSAQIGEGAKIERVLKPVAVWEKPKGHIIYDFGQNMVGTVRLTVKAERGTSFRLRYGEMCERSGELYLRNLRTAANTDIYTCKGAKEGETFLPSFTVHGFRYVEITGNGFLLEDQQVILSLEGLVLCQTTRLTGGFICSNPKINQLWKNIEWGQRGNYLLVPTDCPQRNERMGWTGDTQVFVGTAVFLMDVCMFLRKWLQDLQDAQLLYHKQGAVPDTAPLGGDNRIDGCGGWGDAAVIVPWELYLEYGDIRILEENYAMMQQWVAYQSMEERQNYGIRIVDGIERPKQSDFASIPFLQVQQRRGDHLTFDESTPFILSATAYAAYTAKIMEKVARLLGKEKDANEYQERFLCIQRAFCEAWVKEDGTLGYWGEMSRSNLDQNGKKICETYYSNEVGNPNHPSQTAYALAIDFHLIPEDKLEGAAKGFLQAILERKQHISVGFLGISHINPALSKVGLLKEAFALLEQEENPSWLYSVKNGATTIWERWDSYHAQTDTFGDVSMNSFNHYAYGAIGEWIYREILGIQTSKKVKEVGYKRIILKPTVGGRLHYAKGYHDSIYGRIESGWEVKENQDGSQKILYQCKIPANTTGEVVLPSGSQIIDGIEGISNILEKSTERKVVFFLQSGSYRFSLGEIADFNKRERRDLL